MGSYGERWIECTWCGRWGQCREGTLEPMIDIDAWGGVFCLPCYEQDWLLVEPSDKEASSKTSTEEKPEPGNSATHRKWMEGQKQWAKLEASPAQLNDEITDDKRMNDGPKEELFLSLSHGDALFAVGYEDNGSDLSEGFLERRRGQYARLRRGNYSPA